ncbi:MAG: hypothetical protein NXI16_14395 [Alphaproteobacteria bacterium]|nr:hypothetical protein [Alphaproteobacteria bacterium]
MSSDSTSQATEETPSGSGGDASPTITIRYIRAEDRLRIQIIESKGKTLLFDLTRRMTGPLIGGLANILETSNPTLARTPADFKQDAMEMSHQAGVSSVMAKEQAPEVALEDLVGEQQSATDDDSKETVEGEIPPHKTRIVPPLIAKVHFTPWENGKGHTTILEDLDGDRTGLQTPTAVLHGILELLIKKSREAEWSLNPPTKWAAADAGEAQSEKGLM